MWQGPVATAVKASFMNWSLAPLASAWKEDYVVDARNLCTPIHSVTSDGDDTKTYLISEDPRILLIPEFLRDEDVELLLAIFEERWRASELGTDSYNNNTTFVASQRTSSSAILEWAHTPNIHQLELRLAKLANLHVDNLEGLVGVRYEPGQYFSLHHDGSHRPVTVFLYLNDLPDGDAGETRFPALGLKITPRKGAAVLWHNCGPDGKADMRVCHEALPSRTGIKYGMNSFFHELPLRKAKDEMLSADMHSWIVRLTRASHDDKLGVVFHEVPNALVIDAVKFGLMAQWNSKNIEREVRPGDFIVCVNGVSGNAEDICAACQSIGVVEIGNDISEENSLHHGMPGSASP